MVENEFILNFIEKNYILKLDNGFLFYDIVDKKNLSNKEFFSEIEIIFTNSETKQKIFNLVNFWASERKAKLVKDLDQYIKSMDLSLGFIKLINKLKKKFYGSYSESFLIDYFNDYYNKTVIEPELKTLLGEFNNISKKNGFEKILGKFDLKLNFESELQKQFITDYLIKFYKSDILEEKLNDFFNNLIVTLGPRNWRITLIGSGELTRNKLEEIFGDEPQTIYDYIYERFDEWYYNAVERATILAINRNK
jgi:hypothetical protein